MKINFVVIISLFLISGCASHTLTTSQLTAVQNGMQRIDVNVQLKNKKPIKTGEFQQKNISYQVDLFDFMIGTSPSITMVCTPTCIAVPISIAITRPYVFIYEKENQDLVVFGLVDDLLKSQDERASQLTGIAQTTLGKSNH